MALVEYDVYRLHRTGRHDKCDYRYCKQRQSIEYEADETLFARAVFSELTTMNIDPAQFWGNGLDKARCIADRQIPGWLPQEIDRVTRLQARNEITSSLAEEIGRSN